MKLNEIKQFQEHDTSAHPDAISHAQQVEWLQSAERLTNTVSGRNGPALSIFCNKLDSRNHIFILTNRTAQTEPVGYCTLQKSGKWWNIEDVWIMPALRKQGLMTNFLYALNQSGYSLKSGDVLSADMENVWKSLSKHNKVSILDVEDNSLKPFDLSPIGSGSMKHGIAPRYYWVMEGEISSTIYHRSGVEKLNEGIKHYLDGVEPGGNNTEDARFKVIGMGTFILEADI